MKVINSHERTFNRPAHQVGALLDRLASKDDGLWPHASWPAMRFDRDLQIGANGGHGPIRYRIEDYQPGQSIRFRFHRPRGFNGYHEFVIHAPDEQRSRLEHRLCMQTSGMAQISWPLIFRPLHDALIEDALDNAAASLGEPAHSPSQWSIWVRILRRLLAGRA
ncbi:MAG: SRPBCC family protein [Pseudomonadota bacterium]